MRKLLSAFIIALALLAMTGCGGDDAALTAPVVEVPPEEPDPDEPPPAALLAKISLLTSIPQIPSDGALPATITAQVQDVNNVFVPGVTVNFSATSGGLITDVPVTDNTGKATVIVETAGDPTNRTITVTGTVTDVDGTTLVTTVDIAVIGTQLTLTGPTNLVQGDSQVYTVVLADANGDGINGETVTITSRSGNSLSANSLTTDAAGQAQFTLTATQAGGDTISSQALGLTATRTIDVSDDTFAFVAPAANSEINLSSDQTVIVRWTQGGAPVVGQSINFATTRGVITPSFDLTDSNGEVLVSITAANAGLANITASTSNGPSTTLPVEFVATNADTIEVQADPFNVAPSEQSTITAVVRDPSNNLVKNKTVVFQLDDVTGGTLSVGKAVTDSQGRAQTFYTANTTTSGSEGVVITAFVEDDTAVTDSTILTVARRELFFSFGTGNVILEPDDATYEMPFVIFATDADGNPVEGVTLQLSLLSARYSKGQWFADELANAWFAVASVTCPDEDVNNNGILDAGEDMNGSGQIEAGNIAAVIPGFVVTDERGRSDFVIQYAQVHGAWLEVDLKAKTDVQGTEFSEGQKFVLAVAATDVNSLDKAPPGIVSPEGGLISPFGFSDTCADTL